MTAHRPISDRREIRRSSQPRRGLSRDEAAIYMGISATKFDEGVAAGLLPKPRTGGIWGSRKVWDRVALDAAWDGVPDDDDANPWDAGRRR